MSDTAYHALPDVCRGSQGAAGQTAGASQATESCSCIKGSLMLQARAVAVTWHPSLCESSLPRLVSLGENCQLFGASVQQKAVASQLNAVSLC